MTKRPSWLSQLVTIAGKGAEARQAGLPLSACPYKGYCRGLQGQRATAWHQGWHAEDREIAERTLAEQDRMKPSEP